MSATPLWGGASANIRLPETPGDKPNCGKRDPSPSSRSRARLAPALQHAHDDPHGEDDYGAQQEIVERPAKGIEAEVGDPPHDLLQPLHQVEGRNPERREDDADNDRDQHQPDD